MPQGGNGGGPAKGVNKILGNWKDDLLIGTDGVDVISGRGGNDILEGLGGNDQLDGGDGDDVLTDLLGDNTLDGGAGDDTLSVSGLNNDVLTGGTGADIFSLRGEISHVGASPATTTITDFEIGVDRILLSAPFDLLAAAQQVGDDVHIEYSDGLTLVLQGVMADALQLSDFEFAGANVIVGTVGNDSLTGTLAADIIYGLDGNDTIFGGGGDDFLYARKAGLASGANPTIFGGSGNDHLYGGWGDDTFDGGDGDDYLNGHGYGTDIFTGGSGADIFSLTPVGLTEVNTGFPPHPDPAPQHLTTITDFEIGVDQVEFWGDPFDVLAVAQQQSDGVLILTSPENGVLLLDRNIGDLLAEDFSFVDFVETSGTGGPDELIGSDLFDVIQGLEGDDVISALGGNDTVSGGAGNDILFGGEGVDFLDGGDGDDLLIGRFGDDFMVGGAGADVFGIHIPNTTFALINSLENYGDDNINDFEVGVDTIRFGWEPFDVLASATQITANAVRIDYAAGSSLTLFNVTLAELTEESFVFDSTPVEDPGLLLLAG